MNLQLFANYLDLHVQRREWGGGRSPNRDLFLAKRIGAEQVQRTE